MDGYLIGLDLGTSGCKGSLIDSGGLVINESYSPYSPVSRSPGFMEQPLDDWRNAVISCLNDIADNPDISPSNIAGIAVAAQMRGVVLLDKELNPLRDAILWNDIRCADEVEYLKNNYLAELREITCNPINSMCTLPKLMWVRKHEAGLWSRVYRFLYPKDYINFILTGRINTDHSDASGSSFYDIRKGEWSAVILDAFGFNNGILGEINNSFEVLGTLSGEIADRTGLFGGTPVITGCSDGTAEMLALGITESSACKIRLGTSGAVSSITDEPGDLFNPETYIWSYFQQGRWMIDLNTRSCAHSIEWLRSCCYSEYSKPADAYAKMIEDASAVPAGAEGILFHPYLLGEDAPYWNSGLRGSFSGLISGCGRGHLARAVMEGVSFSIKDAASVLGDKFSRLETVKLTGGGVRNGLWIQILLDVLGKSGEICNSSGSSYGAAMLAGIGCGLFKDTDDAVSKCVREERTVDHNPVANTSYGEYFTRYKSTAMMFDKPMLPS